MKRVLTTGTFDLFHVAHLNLLKRAKEEDNFVIVGLNSDELISYKKPIYTYEQRKAILEAIRYVDAVVPMNRQEDKYRYIKELRIDEFVIGSDYADHDDLKEISKLCNVRVLDRTQNVSTTQAKQFLNIDYTGEKTFVIDIDDTISTTHNRDFDNAEPIQRVIDKMNELHNKGFRIVLHTARGMKSQRNNPLKAELKYKEITERWLKNHNVKYDELLFGKYNAIAYVDDKNITPKEFVKLKR